MSQSRVPQPSAPYRHKIPCQLRFNDIDMFGHVNNSVYLQFFDLAKLDYIHNVLGKDFNAQSIAMVVANINCDFHSPAKIDEQLEVLTAVIAVGDKSMVLEQRIQNLKNGDVKCTARTVMVGFDIATSESAQIPDVVLDAIESFEHRKFS